MLTSECAHGTKWEYMDKLKPLLTLPYYNAILLMQSFDKLNNSNLLYILSCKL